MVSDIEKILPISVKKSKSKSGQKVLLFVVIGVLLIIVAVGSGYFLFGAKIKGFFNPVALKVGSTEFRQSDVQRHDKALVGYYKNTGSITEAQIKEIAAGREKVVKFANENGITVSDSEVQSLKDTLIKETGREKVMADIAVYNWTEKDWAEVLWWQILREKILDKFQAYREGEWISLRWDAFSPELNEANAAVKTPAAKKYMEDLHTRFLNKAITLKQVYETFDVSKEPGFAEDRKYLMQYSGLDERGVYTKFKITPLAANSQILTNLKFPGVSEVTCTIAACSFYNIVAGSNGHSTDIDVQNFLRGDYLI